MLIVSTHSRLKAAGMTKSNWYFKNPGFNTQPPEGGWLRHIFESAAYWVSTHSRPKAAGQTYNLNYNIQHCFNTQPPEGGWKGRLKTFPRPFKFQHTAARRRLGNMNNYFDKLIICFNTQPPEGGWVQIRHSRVHLFRFNTQPPEGGWKPARQIPS